MAQHSRWNMLIMGPGKPWGQKHPHTPLATAHFPCCVDCSFGRGGGGRAG